jgi:phage-related protein
VPGTDEKYVGSVGLDTSDWKQGISELNKDVRLIESGFRAVAAGMDDWRSSAEGLRSRQEALNDIIDKQRQKVESTNKMMDALRATYGDNSKEVKDFEFKVNKANEELNKSETELRAVTNSLQKMEEETEDVTVDVDKLGNQAKTTGTELKGNFKNTLSDLSKTLGSGLKTALTGVVTALAAVGTAAVGAAAGVFKITSEAAAGVDDINTLAAKYGLTAERIQELQYASAFVDVSLETMGGSLAKLTRTMSAAMDGNKLAKKAFKELGVSLRDDVTKEFRDSEDIWADALEALGKIENETQRDILAQKLFGRSAQELNPLIVAGGEALKGYADEAHNVGAVMSEETLGSLQVLNDAIDKGKGAFEGLKNTLAGAAAPAVLQITELLTNLTVAVKDAIATGDWTQIGTVISNGLSSAVSQFSDMAPKLLGIVITLVPSLVKALVTAVPKLIPELSKAVLALLKAATDILLSQGPTLIQTALDAISYLVMGLLDALPLILDAAIKIVLALVEGIAEKLPTLIPAAVECVLTLVETIVDNIPMLIDAAIQLILALVDGVIKALPKILEAAPRIVTSLVTGIVEAIPKLLDAALEIITALIKFMPVYLPMLVKAAPEIVLAILTGLVSSVGEFWAFIPEMFKAIWEAIKSVDWGKVGKEMLDGIKEGVVKGGKALVDSVVNAAKNSLNGVKNFLQIRSPSAKAEKELGGQFVSGWSKGIRNGADEIRKSMTDLANESLYGVDLSSYSEKSASNSSLVTKRVELDVHVTADGDSGVNKESAKEMGEILGKSVVNELRGLGVYVDA